MKFGRTGLSAIASISLLAMTAPVGAAEIKCNIDAPNGKNYMQMADSQASACLAAGLGTLSGNPTGGNPDEFLTSAAGSGYVTASKTGDANPFSITYNQGTGTWSFSALAWDIHPAGTKLALGFKWGTGNTPDEYFVFQLVNGVFSGNFEWFPLLVKGEGEGGLSHMILYSSRCVPGTPGCDPPPDEMPEPGTLVLLGLGLIGLGLARRRKSA